ncbi:MAG: M3 family oligoendopeptidase [Chloroflexaceae bacterium]|nr:M3 family oligoendopeptidase [Chloroflexaceae bacterium]
MTSPTSAAGIAWDLRDLFAGFDDPALKAMLDQVSAQAETFATTYRGTIHTPDAPDGPEASHLRAGLEELEALSDRLYRPMIYASLLFCSDTRNPDYRNLQQHVEQRQTAIRNLLLFFELEWLALSDEAARRLVDDPALTTYRAYLQSARRYQPHTLTEPEERIINEKEVTGSQAWKQFFTELMSSLSFPIDLDLDGETRRLTLDQVIALMRNPDRSVRQRAHATLYDTLSGQSQTLAYVYNTLLQDHLTADRLRHYADPMAQRHLANQIAPEVVETMMDVVEQNYAIAHTFFGLKARLLNLPCLQIYDQYAPLGDHHEPVSYHQSRDTVLEAFGAFDEEFRDIAAAFFERGWIDAEVREGKCGGAFCQGSVPSSHPYVLCNYTESPRDTMVLAHELGHAIHFWLSRKQTLFNFYPTLPLAETASVFGEMLVFEHVLNQQEDRAAKLELVCSKVQDIFSTIFRQNVLTRFEQAAFAGRVQSRLTPEQLCACWTEANGRYYGHAVEQTPGYEWGWSYIPHFINTPFYCYSYVFGELLVLALYGVYRDEGPSFIPRYKALLASGGSQPPDDLLKLVGVDPRDPSFWQRGLDELRRLVAWAAQLAEGWQKDEE